MLEKKDIYDYIKNNDTKDYFDNIILPLNDAKYLEDLSSLFNKQKMDKAVLGIDIYHYSQKIGIAQDLTPVLFDMIFEETICIAKAMMPYLYQKVDKDRHIDELIQTGDGGFSIFETPLHAIMFALIFESNVRLYNSGHFYPKLKETCGEITLRYAITYDKLYSYDNNFYGDAIIRNARVLSKDKLNRLLIDDKSNTWFLNNINGVESIEVTCIEKLTRIPLFQEYDIKENEKNYFICNFDNNDEDTRIKSIHICKIGDLKAKNTNLDIYNVQIKASIVFQEDDNEAGNTAQEYYVFTLGNMNSSGFE